MVAEYIAKIKGDISGLEKTIKEAQGMVNRINDDEVLIKFNYDGNAKEFNKVFQTLVNKHPELTVQLQYDLNKQYLEKQKKELERLEAIRLTMDPSDIEGELTDIDKKIAKVKGSISLITEEMERLSSISPSGKIDKALDEAQDSSREMVAALDKAQQIAADMGRSSGIDEFSNGVSNVNSQLDDTKKKLEDITNLGEAVKYWHNDKAETRERYTPFNSKTKEIADATLIGEQGEISGKLVRAAIEQAKIAVDSFIHTHPERVAAFSDADIEMFYKLANEGITNQVVASYEQALSLDMSKVNLAKADEVISKVKAAYNKIDSDVEMNMSSYLDEVISTTQRALQSIKIGNPAADASLQNLIKGYSEFVKTLDETMSINEYLDDMDRFVTSIAKNTPEMKSLEADPKAYMKAFSDFSSVFEVIEGAIGSVTRDKVQQAYQKVLQEVFADKSFLKEGVGSAIKLESLAEFIDFNSVGDAARQIVRTAEEETAKAQKSSSPSKIAEKLGEYWTEGYAEGIVKHKDKVEEAIRELIKTGQLTMMDLFKDQKNIRSDAIYEPLIKPVEDIFFEAHPELAKVAQQSSPPTQANTHLDNIGSDFRDTARVIAEASERADEAISDVTDSIRQEGEVAETSAKQKEEFAKANEHIAKASTTTLFEEPSGQLSFIKDLTSEEKALGDAMSEVSAEAKKSAEQIEGQLSLDFSKPSEWQKKYELAIVDTNKSLMEMAQLAFKADTARQADTQNLIDQYAAQTRIEGAAKIIAEREAERTAEIERQKQMLLDVADAAFIADTNQNANGLINKITSETAALLRQEAEEKALAELERKRAEEIAAQNAELEVQRQKWQSIVDTAFKLDTGQIGTGSIDKWVATNTGFNTSANAIREYVDGLEKATENSEELATNLQKIYDAQKSADGGSSTALLSNLHEYEGELASLYAQAEKERNNVLKTEEKYREAVLDAENKKQRSIRTSIKALENEAEKYIDSKKYVDDITDRAMELVTVFQRLASQDIIDEEELRRAANGLKQLKAEAASAAGKIANPLTKDKYLEQISQYTSKYTALSRSTRSMLDEISEGIRNAKSKEELNALYGQFLRIRTAARASGEEMKSLFTTISTRLRSMNASLIARFFSLYDIIRYVRQVSQNVVELDSALTELRKVSDASTSRLQQNFEKSAETARELGSTISDVINITSDWARLGYNVDQAEELARVTTLFKTVGDNMSADDASAYLVSTMQGFQIAADQAEDIVDKYNEVANNFAIDTAGIGGALQRSAASFNAANTDLSKAIALVTATNEVIQNPESVGTLWKTLSARIRGATTELEDLGEEEDEFTKTTSKLRALVKGLTGFDIMKDENTFKDIYEIILGIGQEWDKLSDVEQASLGEALAGRLLPEHTVMCA